MYNLMVLKNIHKVQYSNMNKSVTYLCNFELITSIKRVIQQRDTLISAHP